MISSITDFYAQATDPVERFDAFARKHRLGGRARADHICYKCGSAQTFERMRALFERYSRFLYQSIISERRIAYIKLPAALESALMRIQFLELSDQKPDLSQREGFDHIEAYPISPLKYEEMVARLGESETVRSVPRLHHPTHDIDIGGGFLFRCTRGPLLDKIKQDEMV